GRAAALPGQSYALQREHDRRPRLDRGGGGDAGAGPAAAGRGCLCPVRLFGCRRVATAGPGAAQPDYRFGPLCRHPAGTDRSGHEAALPKLGIKECSMSTASQDGTQDITAASLTDFDHIPLIDLPGIHGHDATAKSRIAVALRKACTEVGFFYITNHGVPEDLIDKVFSEGR